MTNEDIAMEDALFPWLASDCMSDYASDTMDSMADIAYELEEAMRESDQADWNYIDPMEDIHDDESN